jgi:xanthine dehydrogenase accessory factor
LSDFFSAALELRQSSQPFVVITMVSGRGHAPQDPGAKAIVTGDGLYWGTVGGGKVEARSIERALALLARLPEVAPPDLITWNLQRDIGMTCGGEVTFLFEVHHREGWKIVVFGAGHVAQAVIRTLCNLNCSVTCIDSRPEWIERLPDSPKLKKICAPDPATLVEGLDAHSYFVVMTRGHASDVPILTEIFRRFPQADYVGGIGSKVKALRIKADLRAAGIPDAQLSQFRCPIGLPLGSNDPYEIAISVAAELLQVRDRSREARPE